MHVIIDSLVDGARRATGTVVIIDVFRAFTTAAVAFSRGASKIIMVAEAEEAIELRRRGLGDLCMGEIDGIRPDGFDLGNSPFEVQTADVYGKTVIQSTRAGTVGLTCVEAPERLYAASFAVAGATVRAVTRGRPDTVTIVAMGDGGTVRTDEDEQCALYLKNVLEGRDPDPESVRKLVLAGEQSQKYGVPSLPHFHAMDRQIALEIDSVAFALRVCREEGLLVARPESV